MIGKWMRSEKGVDKRKYGTHHRTIIDADEMLAVIKSAGSKQQNDILNRMDRQIVYYLITIITLKGIVEPTKKDGKTQNRKDTCYLFRFQTMYLVKHALLLSSHP